MAQTTPPKGRPTTGRRDRQVAQRRSRSRSSTKKYLWAIFAAAVLVAVLVFGTGTGGNGVNAPTAGVFVPLVLLRHTGPPRDPRC